MEIQEVRAPAKRVPNPKGNPAWKKGVPTNPKGKPKTGFQDFAHRADYLQKTYTSEQIEAICSDPKKIGKFSSVDRMILMRLYESFMLGGRHAMDALLDRVIGKPDQYVRVDQNNTHTMVMQEITKELKTIGTEELLRIGAILEQPKVTDADFQDVTHSSHQEPDAQA